MTASNLQGCFCRGRLTHRRLRWAARSLRWLFVAVEVTRLIQCTAKCLCRSRYLDRFSADSCAIHRTCGCLPAMKRTLTPEPFLRAGCLACLVALTACQQAPAPKPAEG